MSVPISRRGILKTTGVSVIGTVPTTTQARATQGTQTTGGWPEFQYNAANTGYVPARSGPTDGVEKRWEFSTFAKANLANTPVIADGVLVLTSRDFNIYGVDVRSGEERWRIETEKKVRSTPVIVDGIVYAGGNDGVLRAIDLATGEEQWTRQHRSDLNYRFTHANGTLFAPGNGIVALNPDGGSIKWQTDEINAGAGLGGVAVANGTVYAGTPGTNRVYALDVADGSHEWRARIEGRISYHSSPVVGDGLLFLVSNGGKIHALDATSGEPQWRFDVGDVEVAESTPAYRSGTLYYGHAPTSGGNISNQQGSVYAINVDSGTEQWRVETAGGIEASPISLGETVYVGSHGQGFGMVYALNAADGSLRWSHEVRDDVVGLSSAGNRLYAATEDGYVVALGEQDSSPTTPGSGNDLPTARFSYSPTNPRAGEEVIFDAADADDPDGQLSSYEWTIESTDGERTLSGETVRHTFEEPGEYVVELRVIDNNGATDTITRTVAVEEQSGSDNEPPTPLFDYSPSNPEPNETISFDATDSNDPDGEIVEYNWDFNLDREGRATVTGVQVEHTYDEPGDYRVGLQVVDNAGTSRRTSRMITIEEATDRRKRGFFSNSASEPSFLSNIFNLTMLGFLLSVAGIIHQMLEGR